MRMIGSMKGISAICLVLVLTLSCFAFPVTGSADDVPAVYVGGNTWYVNPPDGTDGEGNNSNGGTSTSDAWLTIQHAIYDFSVSNGDTIIVMKGKSTENVDVTKELTLRAQYGPQYTEVEAASGSDHVFEVTVSNVTIFGFTVYGATETKKAGIYLGSGTEHCTLSYNCCGDDIQPNNQGIYLDNSSYNTIVANVCSQAINNGILLEYSHHNTISHNATNDNDNIGIALSYSDNNTISHNTVESNGSRGISLYYSDDNTLWRNTCNDNYYGICLEDSSGNTIYRNDFSNSTSANAYSEGSATTWNSPAQVSYYYNGSNYENYLGNYWSDYAGSDTDGDGIGETPYPIANDNDDNYPLTEPIKNYVVWTHVFQDPARGTEFRLDMDAEVFQFIAPGYDSGAVDATMWTASAGFVSGEGYALGPFALFQFTALLSEDVCIGRALVWQPTGPPWLKWYWMHDPAGVE